jgi:outer membrane protein assembly factor BamB
MTFNRSTKQRCSNRARLTVAIASTPMALVATALLCVGRASAEDWPVVRGNPSGTAVAAGKLPDTLEVLWTYKTGESAGFDATPVIANGVVYIGDSNGTVHAVNLATGKAVWTKSFEGSSGFSAGGAIQLDRLYIADMSGVARCLDIRDGSEKWQIKLESEVHAGPTPIEGAILFTTEAGTLTSHDLSNGEKKWEFKIDAPLRCAPTISNGRVMLAGCDSLLHAISVSDGKEVFTVPIDGPTGATAAMFGNRVYFGTENATFFGIDVNNQDGKTPAVAWTYKDPRRAQPIRSAAAVTENLVVFGSQGRAVTALDPKTGEEKWKVTTRSRVDSSPVIVGDRVVAATSAGKLYLLDATKDGEIKWESDLGGGFNGSPAVVDGKLLIGNTDGTLYCFGSKPANAEKK